MSTADVLQQAQSAPAQQRKLANAIWQPFLQFKLLIYLLGSTAVVALLLAVFLYFAFSDLIGSVGTGGSSQSYYAEMVEMQLVHLFRYSGALFVLYILLLATVCVIYTHKLIGPFRPYKRHLESLIAGDYSARVKLRKGDIDMFVEYANQLNQLAESLQQQERKR